MTHRYEGQSGWPILRVARADPVQRLLVCTHRLTLLAKGLFRDTHQGWKRIYIHTTLCMQTHMMDADGHAHVETETELARPQASHPINSATNELIRNNRKTR
eukprot:GHVU01092675.1.p1 GENE.GHVU01092675.1~~GHVU01092675.1.p1  ORF type:complete len:102 (-),score=1.17 GHVU01092675.1:198-503(-)